MKDLFIEWKNKVEGGFCDKIQLINSAGFFWSLLPRW